MDNRVFNFQNIKSQYIKVFCDWRMLAVLMVGTIASKLTHDYLMPPKELIYITDVKEFISIYPLWKNLLFAICREFVTAIGIICITALAIKIVCIAKTIENKFTWVSKILKMMAYAVVIILVVFQCLITFIPCLDFDACHMTHSILIIQFFILMLMENKQRNGIAIIATLIAVLLATYVFLFLNSPVPAEWWSIHQKLWLHIDRVLTLTLYFQIVLYFCYWLFYKIKDEIDTYY